MFLSEFFNLNLLSQFLKIVVTKAINPANLNQGNIMQYCYHCSEPISKPAKICPHCKRTMDMSAFESLLAEHESSHLSKKSLRRIWRREHSYLFWPFLTLVIGFIIGGILTYGFAQLQFSLNLADGNLLIKTLFFLKD